TRLALDDADSHDLQHFIKFREIIGQEVVYGTEPIPGCMLGPKQDNVQ
ncbi:4011_t:CDS:1, partial [Racocetra persica]